MLIDCAGHVIAPLIFGNKDGLALWTLLPKTKVLCL
jgi:hypothetical protein